MANTKVQSEQIEDGSITADKLADGTIVAAELADNAVETAAINADAVTGAKIADNAIDSEHYTDGSIDTAHIADAQITVGKMAANSVDSDQYVDGSIDTVHIADLQVTTAKIANGNISTAKIADNAVTSAKIDTNIDIAGTFDVTGAATFDSNITMSNASSPTILMTDTTNTLSLKMFSGNTTANIGTTTNHALTFFTNDGERVLIDAAGDMTLKTAGKRYYVPRASDGAATGSLYSPTDSNIRLSGAGSSAGTLEFQPSSGSGVSMSINSSGVVSLTKTGSQFTPLSYDQLVIQNGDATGIRLIDSGDGGGNGGHCGVGNDNGNLQLSTAGVMLFDTGFEATDQVYNGRHERMRILSTGLIAIGTQSNTVAKVSIVESESRDCLRLTNTRNPSSSAPYVATFGFNYQPNNGTSTFLACQDDLDGSPTNRCIIQSNGGIANYQSNNSNLSDARLKTDIQNAPNALDIINNLKVRTFKYHDQTDEKIHTGLIAQEAETVDLSIVNQDGWSDEAPEGEEPYKSIYNTDLMFKMLKAIQEQQTIIEAQATSINDLKTRIEALES